MLFRSVRSEDVIEIIDKSARMDVLEANVEVYEHMGSEIFVYIDYKGQKIIAKFSSDVDTYLKNKENIRITFKPEKIHLFDKETEISLLDIL